MLKSRILVVALLGLFAGSALAVEYVGVAGSDTKYPTPIARKIGGKKYKLVLTGTAMRKKFIFNVYTMGSYIQEGVAVRSAEELAGANVPKQLHLVMERAVDGDDMAAAFETAIRMNYPAPAFESELAGLMDYMRQHPVQKGDQVWLTHVPGAGLHCKLMGHPEIMINNPAFAHAVWNIYLGPNNLGDYIKRGLTSRL